MQGPLGESSEAVAFVGPEVDKLVLVIRSRLFREGLRRILNEAGFQVIGEVSTADEISGLLDAPDLHQVATVIVETSLCSAENKLLIHLHNLMPHARITLLVSKENFIHLKSKDIDLIDGILSFETPGKLLTQILQLMPRRHCLVTTDFLRALLTSIDLSRDGMPESKREEQVPSRRESEILRCLIDGCSNKAIARQLGITEATVKVHLKGLLRKIRAANRTQAAIWAINNGIEGGLVVQPERTQTPPPQDRHRDEVPVKELHATPDTLTLSRVG
jgi:two-component system nitrate/nitrite response regulator NarL